MTVREHIKKGKFILKGIATYLPAPFCHLLPEHQHQFKGTGQRKFSDTESVARAYYAVWMRMLVTMQREKVLNIHTVHTIGEIGPGDSLATGLAALLSGADTYIGLDLVPTAHNFDNLALLEEIIRLFQTRAAIPDAAEHPKLRPYLSSYAFPSDILTDEHLAQTLAPERLENIRKAITAFEKGTVDTDAPIKILLSTPWDTEERVKTHAESIDLIITNAAMEHVENVPHTYACAARILNKGGIIASTIDYKYHDTAGVWNGHWTYSPLMWKIVRGKCVYFINRWTHAMHIAELEKEFNILIQLPFTKASVLTSGDIAEPFSHYPLKDFEVSEGFIAAQKK